MGSSGKRTARLDLMQGTLDMLILRTLQQESRHGQEIIRRIRMGSGGSIVVNHGSLYPALQRLLRRGLVRASWGTSANNRRARYYALTASGKKELEAESDRWNRFSAAIAGVMRMEQES